MLTAFISLKADALFLFGWKKVSYFYKIANRKLAVELQFKKPDSYKFDHDHTNINTHSLDFNNPKVFFPEKALFKRTMCT